MIKLLSKAEAGTTEVIFKDLFALNFGALGLYRFYFDSNCLKSALRSNDSSCQFYISINAGHDFCPSQSVIKVAMDQDAPKHAAQSVEVTVHATM